MEGYTPCKKEFLSANICFGTDGGEELRGHPVNSVYLKNDHIKRCVYERCNSG